MDLLISGFNSSEWSNSTYLFYIAIILCCYFSSTIFSNVQIDVVKHRNRISTLSISIPLFIMLCVKGFSICGVDVVGGYKLNFYTATSWDHLYDWSLEVGYRVVNLLIRNFTANYSVFLFLMAVLTLIPMYFVAQKHQNQVHMPIVILGYVSVFFFQGLSLVRIYIAANICLLSFSCLVEKKYLRAYAYVLVASLFHTTALLMFIPCIIYMIRIDLKAVYMVMMVAVVSLIVFKDKMAYFLSGRYGVYSVAETVDIGLEVFCYYLPLIALWIFVKKVIGEDVMDEEQRRLFSIGFLWVAIGMTFGMASYIIPIFGRLSTYTIPIIFFAGVCVSIIKKHARQYYSFVMLALVAYYFLRFQIYINGYFVSDGIMPYINCFGLNL